MAFREALDMYITSRESVLSAGTIREYRRSQKADFHPLEQTCITDITQYDIQLLINEKSRNCKPKTVRNLHGLISAVMKAYRKDFILNTTLPQKQKPDLYIPTDQDIQKIINAVNEDTDMLIAIYLAAFGPLRRSEICGLESTDIINKVAHIQRAVIMNEHNNWITKPVPKSVAGDRFIPLPDFVFDLLKDRQGRIIKLHPNNITDRFEWILKRAGLPHFRFHDLRHPYVNPTLKNNFELSKRKLSCHKEKVEYRCFYSCRPLGGYFYSLFTKRRSLSTSRQSPIVYWDTPQPCQAGHPLA